MVIRKVICISVAGLLASALASAESWDYRTYAPGSASRLGGASAPGYLTLQEKAGESRINIVAPNLNACYESELQASVERTDQSIVITVMPRFPSCEEVRFVIKADGTGGVRQVKRGGAWADDGTERGLTIRK
jgi:hypothetical protein